MKTKILSLAALFSLIVLAASCKEEPPQKEYNIDINNFVAKNFYAVDADGQILNIAVNSPFATRIYGGSGYSASRTASGFDVSIKDNNGDDTREIMFFIRSLEVNEMIKGWGSFWCPIVVRQQDDETSYLGEDDLKDLVNNDEVDWSNDSYILGTVKSISTPYSDGWVQRNAGYFDFPLLPNVSVDQSLPYDLECVDLVVESEGIDVKVQVAWHKAYNLISKMNVREGDTVEIYADKKGVIAGYKYDIIANPLSVVVKNN